ncbi:MAG: hypothetical protein UZ22_OP11002000341 [Microgenomates bacterium OLB23]|nr:MAG: hypothetical protein UZ22_OP11002000341 [Microgenomates bacterium OLB23]
MRPTWRCATLATKRRLDNACPTAGSVDSGRRPTATHTSVGLCAGEQRASQPPERHPGCLLPEMARHICRAGWPDRWAVDLVVLQHVGVSFSCCAYLLKASSVEKCAFPVKGEGAERALYSEKCNAMLLFDINNPFNPYKNKKISLKLIITPHTIRQYSTVLSSCQYFLF